MCIFLVSSFLVGTYFTTAINRNLETVYINAAINLSENYSQTLSLAEKARNNIEYLLEERLITSLLTAERHLDTATVDQEELSTIKKISHIDEIYIFDMNFEIVMGTESNYISLKLPSNHPLRFTDFSESNIVFEEARESMSSGDVYHYAYLKSNEGYYIQVGLKNDSISYLSEEFNSQQLLETLQSREDIIDAVLYLNQDFLENKGGPNLYPFDDFEKESFDSKFINYRISELNDKKVLQILAPIVVDDVRVGTLIIFQNLDYQEKVIMQTFQMLVIIFIIINSIVLALLALNYSKKKNIENLSYIDSETGIQNKNSFIEFLENHLVKGFDDQHYIILIVFNNMTQLKLKYSEEDFEKHLSRFMLFLISYSSNADQAFQFYDDTIVLYYTSGFSRKQFIKDSENFRRSVSKINPFKGEMEIKIGLLALNDNYTSAHQVTSNISAAIKEIRLETSDTFSIFDRETWESITYRERLQADLRSAYLDNFDNEFFVVYQPIVNRRINKVVGFESLARWKHPKYGLISPEVFIQVAEKSHLIIPLGDRIFELTFKFIQELESNGFNDLRISINVSYAQLKQAHFVKKIKYQLESFNVKASSIAIEVTETLFIDDFEVLNQTLTDLREMGIKVYLDDFGTGYSSLERIKNISLDAIKIDRGFINMIDTDDSLLSGIFMLTNNLNYDVIAEGVETEAQLKWLEDVNCYVIQGYYYSKPLKKKEAIKYLEENFHPE